jgi:uncharacterized protein (TIGR00369 family)
MENGINLEDNGMCYACGKKNTKGLHLDFLFDEQEQRIETTFVPSDDYQGWNGVVHGGIIATLMDECMAKLAQFLGYRVVTASLTVRFKDVAKTGKPLSVRGEITKLSKKLIYAKAETRGEGGKVVAEAQAKLMVL